MPFFRIKQTHVVHVDVEFVVEADTPEAAMASLDEDRYRSREEVDEDFVDVVDGSVEGPTPCDEDGCDLEDDSTPEPTCESP